MLEELNLKYHQLSDGLILELNYFVVNLGSKQGSKRSITMHVQAHNYQNAQIEVIKISFIDVVEFKFYESKKICNTVIFELFMEKEGDVIVFDFNPILVDGYEVLAKNPNSNFIIHCKEIKYELINTLGTSPYSVNPG